VAIAKKTQAPGVIPPGAGLSAKGCEALAEWMSEPTFSDGSARDLPSLTLFLEGGRLKACYNDKAEGLTGFLTLDGLELLAEQLSEALDNGKVDWRGARKRVR